MFHETQFLIVGAGPYGLSAAAYAQHLGMDTLVVGGAPMGFWRRHMPHGMFLRTPAQWHLDPLEEYTLSAYLAHAGLTEKQATPIPVEVYVGYADWFVQERRLPIQPARVAALRRANGRFQATLDSGETVQAEQVLVAPGLSSFPRLPPELVETLPPGRYQHTSQLVEFGAARGQRVLIVGGRQSAFEWAALIAEHGAAAVHISYRHDTPRFEAQDLAWMDPLVRKTAEIRGWYRRLPPAEQESIRRDVSAATRLRLEPWLAPRLNRPNVHLWPNSRLTAARLAPSPAPAGAIHVTLDSGEELDVDQVVLATGYSVDLGRVPYLAAGNLLPDIAQREGYPALDEDFGSNLHGLFFTGLVAARDFGPLFTSVAACRAAARRIGERVSRNVAALMV